ncbi:hypothetical protein Ancab_029577 [Ancistrocladus abbreviatus]
MVVLRRPQQIAAPVERIGHLNFFWLNRTKHRYLLEKYPEYCRCPPVKAELWAILAGLRLARSLGYRSLNVECDSSCAVSMGVKVTQPGVAYSSILGQITRLLRKPWMVRQQSSVGTPGSRHCTSHKMHPF